jgi:hypothetical protein
MAQLESEIAVRSPTKFFVDARASARLDAKGRDEWSAFGKQHRPQVERVVVLVRSKLLEMAFGITGMAVGGRIIRMVASEGKLLEEVRRFDSSFRSLPDPNTI